jgi:hypothetical protein
MRERCLTAFLTVTIAVVPQAFAASISLMPAKDNTLIQWSPSAPGANPHLSNGAGDIFVGRTGQDGNDLPTVSIRRGLVQFDIASAAIPTNATITNVTLTMRDVMGLNGDPAVSLHRLSQDWGEGTSFFSGGQGAPATDGDATWLYRFFVAALPESSLTWGTPGGDFATANSASATITDDAGGGQLFSWTSPTMVADVQAWLANPGANFGWLLKGDEEQNQTAKRFNSGDSLVPPNLPPLLAIEYVLAGDYNDDGAVNAADYVVWRRFLGTSTVLRNEATTPGEVTAEDYDVWQASYGNDSGSAGTGYNIPEPNGEVCIVAASIILFVASRRHCAWQNHVRGLPKNLFSSSTALEMF